MVLTEEQRREWEQLIAEVGRDFEAERRNSKTALDHALLAVAAHLEAVEAALGEAVAALAGLVCECCGEAFASKSEDRGCDSCQHTRLILANPDARRAGEQWAAMREVCSLACKYRQAEEYAYAVDATRYPEEHVQQAVSDEALAAEALDAALDHLAALEGGQ